MAAIPMKETRLILQWMIWILELEMLHLKQNCSIGNGTFD
jgi:hypothetical protein